MKKYGILILASLIFTTCSPDYDELLISSGVRVTETWRIDAGHSLATGQGAVYGDEYWVYTTKGITGQFIEIFDINNREKIGEIEIADPHFGYGRPMNFVDGMMYLDEPQLGIVIIDANAREIVASNRYMWQDEWWWKSATPSFYHDGYVYKALYSNEKSNISRFSIETGESEIVYEWFHSPDHRIRLSAPIVEKNNGALRFYNKVFLRDKDDTSAPNESFFINGLIDSSYQWIDTLLTVPSVPYDDTNAVFFSDNIIFNHASNLYSVKKSDGTVNWIKDKNFNNDSQIVIKDNQYFLLSPFSRLEKFDPATGNEIWYQEYIANIRHDFELVDNKIVYCTRDYGSLAIRDGNTGEYLTKIENPITKASNPKYHAPSKRFITHYKNEIIAFTIEDD